MSVDIDVTPEPEPVVDDGPDVVVVDTGDSGGGDDIAVGVMLGTLTARVEELAVRVEELASRTVVAEVTAEGAEDAAEDAVEALQEVVEELIEETEDSEPVEPDHTPEKVHWAHRDRHELFSKGDN